MSNRVFGLLNTSLAEDAGHLCGFLSRHLPEIGGEDWWSTHVVSQLTYGQQGQVRARGITRLEGLDLAARLRIFERNWAEVSYRCKIPDEIRTHAREIADLRNRMAHAGAGEMPTAADTFRALDTLERFLRHLEPDSVKLGRIDKARSEALGSMISDAGLDVAAMASAAPPLPASGMDAFDPLDNISDVWKGLPTHRIGSLILCGPGEAIAAEIPSFAGRPVAATANPWRVTGSDGSEFLIQVVMVDEDTDGEFGQVFCESRLGSPQVWDDVVKRLRVGIRKLDDGSLTMDLRAGTRPPGGRTTRNVVPIDDLDRIAGLDTLATLQALGAIGVGTREVLYGETNKWRNWPAVTFAADDILTPAAAWLVTTLCPLLNSES